jgi:hypothetical protein
MRPGAWVPGTSLPSGLLARRAGPARRPPASRPNPPWGDAVERIGSGSWPDGFAMGHQPPDGIEPIPLLARESEPIVPPLRSITAPCAKSVYSQEFADFAQVPLALPPISVPI